LDFRYIHFYQDSVLPPDANFVADQAAKIFPGCKVDAIEGFAGHGGVDNFMQKCDGAKISEVKQPFEKQPKPEPGGVPLYDGFALQQLLRASISGNECDSDHVHIIITDLLTCTFDEADWRYHARPVICGTPSIISSSGIVEGPARPKEYYFQARPGLIDPKLVKKEYEGRFIDSGDPRLTSAALEYSLQALFFFITDGEPFCENENCRLFNAHWQEEIIRTIANPVFCTKHGEMLNKFNARRSRQ
jgi:hypothetical protein